MAEVNSIPRSVLFPLRIFFGVFFLHSGWGKLTGNFLGGEVLKGILEKWIPTIGLREYVLFLKDFVIPHITFFSYLVAFGETLSGLFITFGCLIRGACLVTIFMNSNFLIATMSQGAASVGVNLACIFISITLFLGSAGRFWGIDLYLSKRFPNFPF
ncbi:DoxX family membrane protein [bacterium]|nr:DoxX family membrane protein [bacterium]